MATLRIFWLSLFIATPALGSVTAYFNHNQSASYTDPYRKITRHGDNLEEVLLKEISLAKKSIYIAVQEFRLPLVAQALIDKKNAGVDVRIVLENSYNFTIVTQTDPSEENEHDASRLKDLKAFVDLNKNGKFEKNELETRDAIYMLMQARVPVIDDRSDGSSGSGLMHHKFMIVDGKTTVISTANFTMSCVHGDVLAPSSRGNSNSMILVHSSSLAKIFSDEFAQLWGSGRRGNFGQRKTYRGPITTTVSGVKLTVQFSPTSQKHNWEDSVNGLIAEHLAKAKQSIKSLLFVFSDQKIANVMESRRNSGVDIGVIIEKVFANRSYSELLDLMGLEMLDPQCKYVADNQPWKNKAQEAGMATLPDGDVLHHKFAVVDRRTVIVGSQNWSDSANYINDEFVIIIENAQIAEQFGQEYLKVKRSAVLGPSSLLKQKIRSAETLCADKGLYR